MTFYYIEDIKTESKPSKDYVGSVVVEYFSFAYLGFFLLY